jgi:unsaturated chondroitin disaccharide hydrolase
LKQDSIKAAPTEEKKSAGPSEANKLLERTFATCLSKTRRNIKRLADDPKAAAWADDGNYFEFKEGFYDIGNWTSSFFTGMALIAWQQTEDESFLKEILRLAPHYREKVFTHWLDTHHDLGFLYSLYSVPLCELTGDKEHREVGLRAAEVLAERFNPKGGFIRAWGRMDSDEPEFPANMAIIDCLMNLPLLYWAGKQSRNAKFHDLAVRHADMALKCFIRADDSVCHAYRFDLETGNPIGPDNVCGDARDSYWARGATWASYGFALSYQHTRDRKYLEASLRVAKKFIAQLDSELVPLWDFRLPKNSPHVRDASAAAIAVCGFQELEKQGAADAEIKAAKNALLDRICKDYIDFNEACPGVLKFGYGSKDAYSSWGDYFLMEALSRELFGFHPWW